MKGHPGYPAEQLPGFVADLEFEFRDSFSSLLADLDAGEEIYDFTGFVFPDFVYLPRSFSRPVRFCNAIFKGRASFQGELKGADFASCEFRSDANFYEVRFDGDVSFVKAKFNGGAYFSSASFKGPVSFNYSKFRSSTLFINSRFDDSLSFDRTTFKGASTFNGSFGGEARFNGATFEGLTDFFQGKFEKRAGFEGVTFKASARFLETQFADHADFSYCEFLGRATFLDTRFEECDFTNINPESARQLVLDNANLSRATFLNTNVEGAVFRQVTWRRVGGRHVLWDEVRPLTSDKPREYGRIAENYRQLVINHERKRDFDSAEKFHIGEMEMRRMMLVPVHSPAFLRAIRSRFNSYALYSFLSKYGTSYVRASSVLVAMILIFSLGFLFLGFQTTADGKAAETHLVRYRLCAPWRDTCAAVQQWLPDAGQAIAFTLSIVTFQRDRPYTPNGTWSRFWLLLATAVLTGQAALLLLAIRRRFKR